MQPTPGSSPTPDPCSEVTPRPKGSRGGARPGAGAPKGNLNALKHSRFSHDMLVTGMVMAIFPEVNRFFDMVIKTNSDTRRRSYRDLVLASRVPSGPNNLTDSIKLQSIKRLQIALHRIRGTLPDEEKIAQTTTQSKARTPAAPIDGDFDFIPILDALNDRANHTGIWHPNAFPDD